MWLELREPAVQEWEDECGEAGRLWGALKAMERMQMSLEGVESHRSVGAGGHQHHKSSMPEQRTWPRPSPRSINKTWKWRAEKLSLLVETVHIVNPCLLMCPEQTCLHTAQARNLKTSRPWEVTPFSLALRMRKINASLITGRASDCLMSSRGGVLKNANMTKQMRSAADYISDSAQSLLI